jgi:hypothetical protein
MITIIAIACQPTLASQPIVTAIGQREALYLLLKCRARIRLR